MGPVKSFIEDQIQRAKEEERERIVDILEGMKKKTHKEVEKKFWFDSTENPDGEFEKYGEYEEFFNFAKKTRSTAIQDVIDRKKKQLEE